MIEWIEQVIDLLGGRKPDRKPVVFVSHASVDLHLARPIAGLYRALDCKTIVAADTLDGGDHWTAELAGSLATADLVLVLWTSSASVSAWVAREITTARATSRRIVPVILSDVPLPESLREFEWVDLRPMMGV